MIFDTLTILAIVLTVIVSVFLLSTLNHPNCKDCETKNDNLEG